MARVIVLRTREEDFYIIGCLNCPFHREGVVGLECWHSKRLMLSVINPSNTGVPDLREYIHVDVSSEYFKKKSVPEWCPLEEVKPYDEFMVTCPFCLEEFSSKLIDAHPNFGTCPKCNKAWP